MTRAPSLVLLLSIAAASGLSAAVAQESFQQPPPKAATQPAKGILVDMTAVKATTQDQQDDDGQSDDVPSDDGQESDGQENDGQEGAGSDRPPAPPGCIYMLDQLMCRERPEVIAARLFEQGPAETTRTNGTRFSVQGFVSGGWPVAVDFLPEPNTRTTLNVVLYDPDAPYFSSGEPVRIVIDENGLSGRRTFYDDSLELPGLYEGGPVRIATFVIRSVRLRENGRPSNRNAPVRVFGIGVGPQAVGAQEEPEDFAPDKPEPDGLDKPDPPDGQPFGSLAAIAPFGSFRHAVGRTGFGASPLPLALAYHMQPGPAGMSLSDLMLGDSPGPLTLPGSGRISVPYALMLRRRFDLVRAELQRDCRKLFCDSLAARSEVQRHQGRVSGYAQLRRRGNYWLNVRAWLICPTPDFTQCADHAAWTTGRTGPLVVVR